MTECAVFSVPCKTDSVRVRAEKLYETSEVRAELNHKQQQKKVEFLISGNFGKNDVHAIFTFDNAHYPSDEEEAKHKFRLFLRRLRRYRTRGKRVLRYIYASPERGSVGGRLHIHAIINAAGLKRAELVNELNLLWGAGNVEVRRIGKCSASYIAAYLLKDTTTRGERAYTPSKGLKQPVVTKRELKTVQLPSVPAGAWVLRRWSHVNGFGAFFYVKYTTDSVYISCRESQGITRIEPDFPEFRYDYVQKVCKNLN